MKRPPLAVCRRFELRNALWGDLAIQLVEKAVVAATDGPRPLGKLIRAHHGLVRIHHDLGGVLAEPSQPENREQRVALGQANEQPVRAPLERLVAEVLDQGRGDLIGVGSVCHLQVEDLQHCGAGQVQPERLP